MTESVTSHITHVDGNWGTSKLRNLTATLSAAVTQIDFVAHTNFDNSGGDGMPPTNHWTMFLQTGSTSSVHVDVAPGDVGRPGMVIVESSDNVFTDADIHKEVAVTAADPTVADIFSIIIANKRDQYVFAPVGEGCRFWLCTFASDLANAGVISLSAAERIQASLAMYWPFPSGSPPVARTITEGRFI